MSDLTAAELSDLKAKAKGAPKGVWMMKKETTPFHVEQYKIFSDDGFVLVATAYVKNNADYLLNANPETILRLIDMIERRDAWQPIETAPKNGTPILVVGGTVHNHDDSAFSYEGPLRVPCIAYWRDYYPECWVGDTLEGHDCFQEVKPTHWQPLPAPPSEALAATEPK